MANLKVGEFSKIRNKVASGAVGVGAFIVLVLAFLAFVLGVKFLVAWGLVTLFNIAFGTAFSALQAFVILIIAGVLGNIFSSGSRVE